MSGNTFCKVILSSDKPVLNCTVAKTFLTKLTGIMFRRQIPYSALLFTDSFWMHSFFCFVNFHIVFLDKNFNVISVFYDVKPNKILPPVWGSKYVIEFFDKSIIFNIGDKLKLEFE
ncbi:MAG: DUF192 domain-containing protein [Candidatus Gastranaerophilales bacterium]|nr:DUF192 domain-containing protein [Candidatus Gastranaerophilales bacterium]